MFGQLLGTKLFLLGFDLGAAITCLNPVAKDSGTVDAVEQERGGCVSWIDARWLCEQSRGAAALANLLQFFIYGARSGVTRGSPARAPSSLPAADAWHTWHRC